MKFKKGPVNVFKSSLKKTEDKVTKAKRSHGKVISSAPKINKETIRHILNKSDTGCIVSNKTKKNRKPKLSLEFQEKVVNLTLSDSVSKHGVGKLSSALVKQKNVKEQFTDKGESIFKEVLPKEGRNNSLEITDQRLDVDKVTAAVTALFKVAKGKKKELLDLAEPIFMQIEAIKIPTCRTKQLHFKLPHPLINELSDILLITTDLKGAKIYPDKAIEHYTELLEKNGINFIQKVIPLRTLSSDYSQYETRRKLVSQYDMILADKRAIKSLPSKLGQVILYRHKMPIPVDLTRGNLKSHFLMSLSKTQMTVKGTGHLTSVQVGNTKMSAREIAANIVAVAQGLDKLFPGGWKNIRGLNIKTCSSPALPVYFSLASPNTVEAPVEEKQKCEVIVGEVSTKLYSKVEVAADGTVTLIKSSEPTPLPLDDSLDDEILQEAREYKKSAKTVHDDDDDDNKDRRGGKRGATTAAMEKKLLENYNLAKQKRDSDDDEGEEDNEEEESSDDEEMTILPVTQKRKKNKMKKHSSVKSPDKKQKTTHKQEKIKGMSNEMLMKKGDQRRGSRGGKKKKLNKVQRKALIKKKKAIN